MRNILKVLLRLCNYCFSNDATTKSRKWQTPNIFFSWEMLIPLTVTISLPLKKNAELTSHAQKIPSSFPSCRWKSAPRDQAEPLAVTLPASAQPLIGRRLLRTESADGRTARPHHTAKWSRKSASSGPIWSASKHSLERRANSEPRPDAPRLRGQRTLTTGRNS